MQIARDKRWPMNDNEFLISEIFHSIQGEGRYAGVPSVFIRLCRCNRQCSFCDTEFNTINRKMTLEEMKDELAKPEYRGANVIWTGGEPTLHFESIENLKAIGGKITNWHIETDGDFICKNPSEHNLQNGISYDRLMETIDYLVCSPKCEPTAKKVHNDLVIDGWLPEDEFEIKIVTDLDKTFAFYKYATSLMPLSYDDPAKTYETKLKVAEYCVKNNVRFCPRLQVDLWGFAKRGV